MSPLRKVVFAIIGLVACATAAVYAAPPQVPIKAFVLRQQFTNPVLSPDGQHLVVTQLIQKDDRDVKVMIVYDLAQMKVVSTVRLPAFNEPAGYTWVSNERLVVSVARETGSLDRPRLTGEVLAMALDGGHQDYLYGYKNVTRRGGKVMRPDEGWAWVNSVPNELTGHFFLTESLWGVRDGNTLLYDIDAVTAGRRLVAEFAMQDFDFVVQHDGKPRFAYGFDLQADPVVFEFDDARKEWRDSSSTGKGNVTPLAMSPDNSAMIAWVSVDRGPGALVRQDVAGGGRTTLVDDPTGTVDLIEWGPYPRMPFAATTNVGKPKLTYFDAERPEAKLHQALSAQFPGSRVHFINFTRDGGKLLFAVRSDRDPGAYYLFDRSTGKAMLLFAERPWIDPTRMAERAPIHFTASDGVEIHGYLTLPSVPVEGKPPLILLPHGGPHGIADDWFFDTDPQFLASRGYAVLQVNYRGSGGRGPGFERSGYRLWGGRVQEDLIQGVRWLVDQGKVDGARMCTYGGSFGAYAAMMTAIRAPGLFKCVVGYSGVYDLARMYDRDATVLDEKTYNYLVKVIGKDPNELASNSPSRLADKLTMPVFLAHGGKDEITPPEQAKVMREALVKAGRPPEWMYIDGEGHGFFSEQSRADFYGRLEAFLATHLGK
ncbi:MAG: S9 family peptidase [Burkholderiales bacterium]